MKCWMETGAEIEKQKISHNAKLAQILLKFLIMHRYGGDHRSISGLKVKLKHQDSDGSLGKSFQKILNSYVVTVKHSSILHS